MRVIAISDLHGYLPEIGPCDVVCICGDIIPLDCQGSSEKSAAWIGNEFSKWADSLPCTKVLVIAGNHDFYLEYAEKIPWNSPKIVYLKDSSVEIDGKVFYGTPWIPSLYRWAFYKPSEELKAIFNKIPDTQIDVLMSHTPPAVASVGRVLQPCWNVGRDFGCVELAEAIKKRPNIKYSVSGHVHSGDHHPVTVGNTTFVNVSVKDEDYQPIYLPFEFKI